jgi:hypothetical protein
MQKVLDQYVAAVAKQVNRRNRQGRDTFTVNENKAIEFYGRAAQQLVALIGAPTPEWVGLKLEKAVRL